MLIEIPNLRNKVHIFNDREDAGIRLSQMLASFANSPAAVLAMFAGGVPVAAPVAEKLNLPLYISIVSKIILPRNTEAGFGAVAFDGTVQLNEKMLASLGLTDEQIQQQISITKKKIAGRVRKFEKNTPPAELSGRKVILVDDGIASGITMQTAVEAVSKSGAGEIIIAVPTAHEESLKILLSKAAAIYCANVRTGFNFAVADAYKHWSDVDEAEAAQILLRFNA
jgi:putative phosphoribosyl transferase